VAVDAARAARREQALADPNNFQRYLLDEDMGWWFTEGRRRALGR